MKTFFTADNHWGHRRIIELSKRPFTSLEEMNEVMIERWNATVTPADTVYHLGDLAFRNTPGLLTSIFPRLNGIKHLCPGNHDDAEVLALPWVSVAKYREIKLGGRKVVLGHYPFRSWNGMYAGAVNLYGHEHGNILDYSNAMDVGVDKWDFRPVSWEQIVERAAPLDRWYAQPPK